MTIEERQTLIKAYDQRAQILIRLPQDALHRYLERMGNNDRLQYRMYFLALKAEKARQAAEANRCQKQQAEIISEATITPKRWRPLLG